MDEAALKDLRTLLRRFAKKNGLSAKYGDWMIAEGGYDLNWQLYHKDTPVIDCIANFINGSGGTLENIEMDRKDFLKVVKVIKEEYPDVLTKAEEKAEMTGLDYKTLWEELEDVPIDENENIDVDWRQFPKGTFREDIWHWFEEEYGISVGELMNGDENGYMKEEDQISLREETPENDCVYTLTAEGAKKVNAYILELHSKRKEILEAGLDTIENAGALPNSQDIIEDVNMSYDEDYKAYYGDWALTDNYEADRTLDLHLKVDLVKTKVLEVNRLDNEQYALVTYQQGNRLGTLIASVSGLEEERKLLQSRYGPDFQQSDMQLVFNMMSSGKLFHVPDLRDLPLIDEQPHALQSIFRESKNCDLGRIYIDEKDGAIYLNEMNCNDSLLFDAMGHNVYPGLEEIKDELRNFVCDHPNFKDIIHFDSCDSPIVIDEDFSTFFAMRDKSLRQMIYIVEDSLMEIASPDSSKEAGRKTLKEAMERRGLDKDDFMDLMQNAAKSKEIRYEIPIGGAVKINTQKERVDAVYTFRKWMKEPGKKIAKEIEALKAKGKGVGK